MGKLNRFSIELAHPRGVCHAGQWLQGYVWVELNEAMKMRGKPVTVSREVDTFISYCLNNFAFGMTRKLVKSWKKWRFNYPPSPSGSRVAPFSRQEVWDFFLELLMNL